MADKAGKSVSKRSQNDPTQLLANGTRVAASADGIREQRLREVVDSRALSSTAAIAHQAEVPLDDSVQKVPHRRRKPKAE